MNIAGFYSNSWLLFQKKPLDDCGFSGIWNSQNVDVDVLTFKNVLKNRLRDQFIQKWSREVYESSKCVNYRIYKDNFVLEEYLIKLPDNLKVVLSKFRCRNNKLPIEIGTRTNVPMEQRVCNLCEAGQKIPIP